MTKTLVSYPDDDPHKVDGLTDDEAELLLAEAYQDFAHSMAKSAFFRSVRHGHDSAFDLGCALCFRG
jgi:hypothetical protein